MVAGRCIWRVLRGFVGCVFGDGRGGGGRWIDAFRGLLLLLLCALSLFPS